MSTTGRRVEHARHAVRSPPRQGGAQAHQSAGSRISPLRSRPNTNAASRSGRPTTKRRSPTEGSSGCACGRNWKSCVPPWAAGQRLSPATCFRRNSRWTTLLPSTPDSSDPTTRMTGEGVGQAGLVTRRGKPPATSPRDRSPAPPARLPPPPQDRRRPRRRSRSRPRRCQHGCQALPAEQPRNCPGSPGHDQPASTDPQQHAARTLAIPAVEQRWRQPIDRQPKAETEHDDQQEARRGGRSEPAAITTMKPKATTTPARCASRRRRPCGRFRRAPLDSSDAYSLSRSRINSRTRAASALPLVAFMT